jgi:hypothetical protein
MNHPPGTVLHFKRFQFEGAATATRPAEKNKFFIVLRNLAGRLVLASLPTSQDQIPRAVEQAHGCMEYPTGDLTAYVFEALKPVATNGWYFSLRTYMYGYQVREYSYDTLARNHQGPGQEVNVKGRLTESEFTSMVHCLLRSIDLKRRFRVALDEARYEDGQLSEPSEYYGALQPSASTYVFGDPAARSPLAAGSLRSSGDPAEV